MFITFSQMMKKVNFRSHKRNSKASFTKGLIVGSALHDKKTRNYAFSFFVINAFFDFIFKIFAYIMLFSIWITYVIIYGFYMLVKLIVKLPFFIFKWIKGLFDIFKKIKTKAQGFTVEEDYTRSEQEHNNFYKKNQ